MSTYNVSRSDVLLTDGTQAAMFRVGFGEPATNAAIVVDAEAAALAARGEGGLLALVNRPASMPAAFAIGHALGHVFGAVAAFDPKMAGYVVCITHDPARPLGSLIPTAALEVAIV